MLDDNDNMIMDAPPPGPIARWIPAVVVLSAVGGFFALAWYAYHAGTQSINDEGLLVVEADKTPMKEQPEDPGGMKVPNQDKTVFETFASGEQAPAKVERVLPTPEEPVSRDGETTTWINQKLQEADKESSAGASKAANGTEEILKEVKSEGTTIPSVEEKKTEPASDNITSYTLEKSGAGGKATKSETKTISPPPDKETKTVSVETQAAPSAKGSSKIKVQLGAYRSEQEARAAWGALQKKYKSLGQKDPLIVKSDLGSKGIYYRLRTGGFANAAEAKSFCSGLKGQACILAPQ